MTDNKKFEEALLNNDIIVTISLRTLRRKSIRMFAVDTYYLKEERMTRQNCTIEELYDLLMGEYIDERYSNEDERYQCWIDERLYSYIRDKINENMRCLNENLGVLNLMMEVGKGSFDFYI